MNRNHFVSIRLPLNCLLLVALILTSCSGMPDLSAFIPPTPTAPAPAPTAIPQAFPLALVETNPPLNSIIGHLSPITFYFNQAMNKPSAESALSGLPEGTFTWSDDATLLFTPTQPYQPNTILKITIANSIQSSSGFGIAEPMELAFPVADYLRTTNILPNANAEDVIVDAAIAASFNQPVVALGADPASQPPAFSLQPSVNGRGEWINTSTYIFYPDPSMAGGTEYTVSLNPDLKTVTGVSLPDTGGEGNAWRFRTSRPRVVTLEPPSDQLLPIEPEIKLTFNQPMDQESVESNFVFSGPEGVLNGTFTWNDEATELTFVPENMLTRNVGYILNVGAAGRAQSGALSVTLGTDYGAALRTYDNFAVTATDPNPGAVDFKFNSPLAEDDYEDSVIVTPALDNLQVQLSEDSMNLFVYGEFTPETNYQIELSAQIRDRWGQSLGDPFILNYRTPPFQPSLMMNLFSTTAFVRPDEPVLYADAVNIQTANVTVSPLSLQDYFTLQNSYDSQQTYTPASPTTFSQTLNLLPSQSQEVKLNLTQPNSQLLSGLYYVSISSPQLPQGQSKIVTFAVSSQVNLTFKLGATEALVWAVDLPSQTPVRNAPIVIYDNTGNPLASGRTDENGLWKGAVNERLPYSQVFAMLSQPGDENFALALNNWGSWISAWDFGYSQNVRSPHTQIYMYTDRPIYRPGQTVYFRGVARQAFNGRYELPPINEFPLILRDANGTQLTTVNAQLSPYGTFNGQFELPENAVPGYYAFENSTLEFYFSFQVAEYRKPEINLSVGFSSDEIKLGDSVKANVNAQYFFDAPAGNVEVHWALYAKPDFFHLPNYETSLLDTSWLDTFRFPGGFGSGFLGDLIQEGTGQTTPQGRASVSIDLPAIPEPASGIRAPQIVTLEVTAEDESGLPVSARTEMRVHPADFYIGIRPDQWIGTAKSPIEFEVLTTDWAQNPSGDKALVAEFKQVRWDKETDSFGFSTYTPVYTPVDSANPVTGPDGRARLSFIPPTAGTYMLDVQGSGAHTQSLVWVGGAGTAAWPDLPNQKLELTADRGSYKAGDTATVFIPNPFITNSLALVTVERGLVSKAEVIQLSGSGSEYSLPLTVDDAPNVYMSVTVLGQGNDFRHGLVNIPVAPDAQALNVQVTKSPEQAGPRDNVTFDVVVTDNIGQPVEGEFSLSVVDLAALALADPNAPDILPAFYSIQPLGIET
ncbi:MAG: Ig-like domain-containing protein, partial [Anaerolineae bacterium]|nr:Ig-like domain-containing protein [Anaerolineae bacterium]